MRRYIFAVVLLAGSIVTSAYALTTTTNYPILVGCTSLGQLCEPPAEVAVSTSEVIRAVEFTASAVHCSEIRVYISIDGVLEYTSAFLGPGGSTGVINVGPVAPGSHTIEVQAEGTVGGCNAGRLISWAGDLKVTTSLYAGTPGQPSCHGDSVSLLANTYGGLPNAARSLGFANVAALQRNIDSYCQR